MKLNQYFFVLPFLAMIILIITISIIISENQSYISSSYPFFFVLSMVVVEIRHKDDLKDKKTFSNMVNSEFGIYFVFVVVDSIFYSLLAFLMEYLSGNF